MSEGYLLPGRIDQGIARLRDEFEAISKERGLGRFELIEVRAKQIRLSTHGRLVLCDWRKISQHPDPKVSGLSLCAEYIYGRPQVRMEVSYAVDPRGRACVLETAGEAGEAVA